MSENKRKIDDRYLQESYVQSSGPGGQNVNKVATTVQLKFDVRNCHNLTSYIRHRLFKLAANKINDNGILLIESSRFRSRELNRKDAHERLRILIDKAAVRMKKRRSTKPTKGSVERRIKSKKINSAKKKLRRNSDY